MLLILTGLLLMLSYSRVIVLVSNCRLVLTDLRRIVVVVGARAC